MTIILHILSQLKLRKRTPTPFCPPQVANKRLIANGILMRDPSVLHKPMNPREAPVFSQRSIQMSFNHPGTLRRNLIKPQLRLQGSINLGQPGEVNQEGKPACPSLVVVPDTLALVDPHVFVDRGVLAEFLADCLAEFLVHSAAVFLDLDGFVLVEELAVEDYRIGIFGVFEMFAAFGGGAVGEYLLDVVVAVLAWLGVVSGVCSAVTAVDLGALGSSCLHFDSRVDAKSDG